MISLKDFLSLTKFSLSFTVSLSLLFGFVLAKNSIDATLLYPFLAVLLLALGVCTLNQVQEYKEDALMPRTKNRPIAAKRITVKMGFIISVSLILISYILIFQTMDILGILIFTAVIIIYNSFYTNSKKTTIYAAVYGAVLGVIPPLIGWISAGGKINDMAFIALAIFYFIWQIPHFWLLNLKYYKEYEKANFPTITKKFGVQSLERITFIWLLLTIICGLFLVLIFYKESIIITSLLIILNIYATIIVFRFRFNHNYIFTFININCYMLLLMILLMVNALFIK